MPMPMPTSLTFHIRGRKFTVPRRYRAGQVITEAEALLLDKAVIENVRDTLKVRVDQAINSGNYDGLEAGIRSHIAEYKLNCRMLAEITPDHPLEHEIQTQAFEQAICDLGPDDPGLEEYVFSLINHPQITQRAKSALASRARLAALAIEDIMP